MVQLPCASRDENHHLDYAVPDRPGIGFFAKIAESRFSFPLKLLLSPYVLELIVEISYTLGELRDMRSIVFHISLRGSDDYIKIHPDMPSMGKPVGGIIGGKADGMIAGIMGSEGKLPFVRASRLDD